MDLAGENNDTNQANTIPPPDISKMIEEVTYGELIKRKMIEVVQITVERVNSS